MKIQIKNIVNDFYYYISVVPPSEIYRKSKGKILMKISSRLKQATPSQFKRGKYSSNVFFVPFR